MPGAAGWAEASSGQATATTKNAAATVELILVMAGPRFPACNGKDNGMLVSCFLPQLIRVYVCCCRVFNLVYIGASFGFFLTCFFRLCVRASFAHGFYLCLMCCCAWIIGTVDHFVCHDFVRVEGHDKRGGVTPFIPT